MQTVCDSSIPPQGAPQAPVFLDHLLAFHCAPTLLGIKPANLVSIPASQRADMLAELNSYNASLNPRGIHLIPVCCCESRLLLLVYQEALLQEALNSENAQRLLETFGYPENRTLEEKLRILETHMQDGSFPHEIGLFLGYPPEDVIGFIENQGRNYKCCGYWKVYADEEMARKRFAQYTRCREQLCHRMQQGKRLLDFVS